MRCLAAALLFFAALCHARADERLNSWHWRAPLPQGHNLQGVAGRTNLYVAVGEAGTVLVSTNGFGWQMVSVPTRTNINGVAYGAGRFVAVGEGGTILTSSTGTNWVPRASPTTDLLSTVLHANGLFVAGGLAGTVLTSPDGISWTRQNSGLGDNSWIRDITFGDGLFVALARVMVFDVLATVALVSTNGVHWQSGNQMSAADTVVFGDGRFLACGSMFSTSPDGLAWSSYYLGSSTNATDLAYADGLFLAANSSRILSSTDGTNWMAAQGATASAALSQIAVIGDLGIAVGQRGEIMVPPT